MAGLIGKKLGMTSVFTEDGTNVPVTAIEAGPCQIVNIKIKDRDGYEALVLGYGERKDKHTNKPLKGFYDKNKLKPSKKLKEFRNFDVNEYKVGDKFDASLFEVNDNISITGTSKGKGFQGVVKRHGFGGVGGRSHGQHNRERAPGSIGQSSYPSRVFKGIRMAGRTGGVAVTVKNLKVVKVIPEKNIVLVKGAVPGSINSIIEINK
jgi:large subunit ribosomal protein L3